MAIQKIGDLYVSCDLRDKTESAYGFTLTVAASESPRLLAGVAISWPPGSLQEFRIANLEGDTYQRVPGAVAAAVAWLLARGVATDDAERMVAAAVAGVPERTTTADEQLAWERSLADAD